MYVPTQTVVEIAHIWCNGKHGYLGSQWIQVLPLRSFEQTHILI